MKQSVAIINFFKHFNNEYVSNNLRKYEISEDLYPVHMQENIDAHLQIIFNDISHVQLPLFNELDQDFILINQIVNAILFVKTVLFVNRIDTNICSKILIRFFVSKDELLNNFLENLKQVIVVYGTSSVHETVYSFLRDLFCKEEETFEVFCMKYFSYCLTKNDPFAIFELPILHDNLWDFNDYLESLANTYLLRFVCKTENYKKKLSNYIFDEGEKSKEIDNYAVPFLDRLISFFEKTKDMKILELFYCVFFENIILMHFINNLDSEEFYEVLTTFDNNTKSLSAYSSKFYKILNIFESLRQYKKYSTQSNEKQFQLIEHQLNKNIFLLLDCWNDNHHKLKYALQNVTILTLKNSLLEFNSSNLCRTNTNVTLEQNALIESCFSENLHLSLEPLHKSEIFIKQYKFNNLIFSSIMTNMVVDSPFLNPFATTKTKLNLQLHFYEYLLLACFQNDDEILFKILKERFYKFLDLSHPSEKHTDSSSQDLLKTTYKKFYLNGLMACTQNEKKVKWNKFLSIWRESFETGVYGNFRIMLIFSPSLKLNKINYNLDPTLDEYVYKLQ
ncbi:hypothetical protein QEN19_003459 [Hanseniaspora menglaensis]